MKKIILSAVLFIVLSFGFYNFTLYYFPNLVYQKFHDKSDERGVKENKFAIIPAPDENSRLVVKPNPDFAYASAFFNIDKAPIQVTGEMPDSTYWSVALYQPNTINFYVKNDLQYNSDILDLIITKDSLEVPTEQILSKTSKGFLLIRVLIENRSKENVARIVRYLESLSIERITSPTL